MTPIIRAVAACALTVGLGAAGLAEAQQGPPPTPVPPEGSPSPYPQSLDTPEPSRRPPDLSAASAALVDLDTGRILYEENGRERRPIASLTKIMTVILVLEQTELDDVVTTSPAAAAQIGSELGLVPGEEIPVEDLLYGLLLQSSNDAAVALAEHVAGSVDRFVRLMNRRARKLGLRHTRYASPHGLDDTGLSTARDLALLTAEAYRVPAFVRIARTKQHVVPAPEGPPRRIQSRNALLWLYPGATGVKTGYTSAAGFSLVASADRDGRRFAAVVLGAPAQAFDDAATLLDHAYFTWRLRTLVVAGEPLEPVLAEGEEVPVEAGDALVALARRGSSPDVRIEPDAGLSLPVLAGTPVGVVTAVLDGEVLGEVPLVASETVRPPPEEGSGADDPLSGVGDAVWSFLMGLLDAIF